MTYYSDIDMSLTKDRSGDIQKNIELESVKNSIINICTTIQGHRVMLPEFAENGYNILFEPVNEENANELGSIIWDSIQRWDNRVELHRIDVNADNTNDEYQFYINFRVQNLTIENETPSVFVTLRRI